MGSINGHKFTHFAMKDPKLQALPDSVEDEDNFKYFIDVYVDDFISMVIACSRKQVEHVAEAVLQGLHNVFDNDPASFKKLTKGDGTFSTEKDCLGFDFDGDIGKKTMQLETIKRDTILTTLHKWIRGAKRRNFAIPFNDFRSTIQKVRHAFKSLPTGKGLLTPCNQVIRSLQWFISTNMLNYDKQTVTSEQSYVRLQSTPPCAESLSLGLRTMLVSKMPPFMVWGASLLAKASPVCQLSFKWNDLTT